jgi:hypothetical protein
MIAGMSAGEGGGSTATAAEDARAHHRDASHKIRSAFIVLLKPRTAWKPRLVVTAKPALNMIE